MKTEEIILENIKCAGCATTIKTELLKLDGMLAVEVFNEQDMVKVSYNDNANRQLIIDKLHSLGYPEATEKNRLLLQLKSYTSCMIGKVNNLTHSNN